VANRRDRKDYMREFMRRKRAAGKDGGTEAPATDGKRVAELEAQVAQLKQALSIVGEKAIAYEEEIKQLKAASAGTPNRALHPLMDRAMYRQLLAQLHPDRVQDEETKQKLTPLFAQINNMENWLCLSEAEEKAKFDREVAERVRAKRAQYEREEAAKRKAKREAAKAKREAAASH
jgi:hypothetical protein